jgi:hypothetical protein
MTMKVPVYQNQVLPSEQTSRVLSLPGEKEEPHLKPNSAMHIYEGAYALANSITQIGEKIRAAEEDEEYSRKQVELHRQVNELSVDMATNPTWKQMTNDEVREEYNKRITSTRGQFLSGIKAKRNTVRLSSDFDLAETNQKVNVEKFIYKNTIDKHLSTLDESTTSNQNMFANTGDPTYLQNGYESVDRALALGAISEKEATDKKQSFYNGATLGYWDKWVLDNITNGANPQQAYNFIIANPKSIADADPKVRGDILWKAQNQWEERQNRDERKRTEDLWLTVDRSKDSIASMHATGVSIPGIREELYVRGGKNGAKLVEQYDRDLLTAGEFYRAASKSKGTNIEEDMKLAESIKPKPGEDRFADKQRNYSDFVNMVSTKWETINKDPAGYVKQSGLYEPTRVPTRAEQKFDTKEDKVRALQTEVANNEDNVSRLLIAQEKLGVDESNQKILAKAEAINVAGKLNTLSPEKAADELRNITMRYGKYANRVYKELVDTKKLSGSMQLVGAMNRPEEVIMRQEFVDAQRIPDEEIKKGIGSEYDKSNRVINETINSELEEWQNSVMIIPTRDNQNAVMEMKEAIRKKVLVECMNTKRDPKTVTQEVTNQLINSRYRFYDNMRLPRNVNEKDLFYTLDETVNNLEKMELYGEFNDPTVKKRLPKNIMWVTNEYGTGVVLYHKQRGQVIDKTGKRIEVFFNKLETKPEEDYTEKGSMLD